MTGVASPCCPEFYVRERENTTTDGGASTVTESGLGNIISGSQGIRRADVTLIMRKWPHGINIAGEDHFTGFTPANVDIIKRALGLITMESTKRFIQFPIKGKLFDTNDNIF